MLCLSQIEITNYPDEVCKNDELVHLDGATQCDGAGKRLESFLIKEQVCCLTFDFDLSDSPQGESWDIHQ
jgi:hypothetical protein